MARQHVAAGILASAMVVGLGAMLVWREVGPSYRRRPRPETSLHAPRDVTMPGYDAQNHYAYENGFVTDDTHLYWLSSPAFGTSLAKNGSPIEVFSQPLAGGAVAKLGGLDSGGGGALGSLAVTGEGVFFVGGGFAGSKGAQQLYRVPKSGGPAQVVATPAAGFNRPALVATREAVYWLTTARTPSGEGETTYSEELHALPVGAKEPRVIAKFPAHEAPERLEARGTTVAVLARTPETGSLDRHVVIFVIDGLGAPLRKIFDTTERSEATFALGDHYAFLTLGRPLETSGPAPLLAVPLAGGAPKRLATLTQLSSIAAMGDDPVVADDEYPDDHPSWLDKKARSLVLRRFDMATGKSVTILRTDASFLSPEAAQGSRVLFAQGFEGWNTRQWRMMDAR